MEIDEPMETPTLRHIVARYYSDHAEASGAYKTLGDTLFEGNKSLIVCEGNIRGTTTKEHVHIQGYSRHSDNQLMIKLREILKPFQPESIIRGYSQKQGGVTETGFQYMCKEYPPKILYQQGILDSEIEALADASALLRAAKKAGLGDALKELHLDSSDGARPCYMRYVAAGIKYYQDQGKMVPPNFKHLVKDNLYKLDPTNEAWLYSVFEL